MTTSEWTWGTTKTHGQAVGDSFEYGGDERAVGVVAPRRVVVVERGPRGTYVAFPGEARPTWLGGVAARYWARAVQS